MTAKEYLISVLNDPYVEASSVQTRTALCAYAIRINAETEGYSLNELEEVIRSCGYGTEFIVKCTSFVSNAKEALDYIHRIPADIKD